MANTIPRTHSVWCCSTVGQLIGPRGQTLKQMQLDSGARIVIRGKGSVKEGKGGSARAIDSHLDEDLHCIVMADTKEQLEKAKDLINSVIETVCILRIGMCNILGLI